MPAGDISGTYCERKYYTFTATYSVTYILFLTGSQGLYTHFFYEGTTDLRTDNVSFCVSLYMLLCYKHSLLLQAASGTSSVSFSTSISELAGSKVTRDVGYI